MRLSALCALVCAALLSFVSTGARAQGKPWPIRAVIITTFEVGNDTGDAPGEFQLWVEREHLSEVIDFPGGVHPLRTNPEHTILGMVSGTTLVNATASMMALGLDPRFDLTHAYILVNGIAGVDPHEASIGSAAWASYVLNDVARFIDPKDSPEGWPYGVFPVGAHGPRPETLPEGKTWFRSNLFPLNAKLTDWAYAQTKNLKLEDDPTVAKFRADFAADPAHAAEFAAAARPPFVLKGDTLASDFYWHGTAMNAYAEDWVKLHTGGKGRFVMTEMEDSGTMAAIERLQNMHRVDTRRVMVLRSGSNYSMPRPGHTAIESVSAPYIGTKVALESAYLAGSTVLHKLLDR